MNIITVSQDNTWKNPISCNVSLKKNAHIYIYIYMAIFFGRLHKALKFRYGSDFYDIWYIEMIWKYNFTKKNAQIWAF